VSAEGDALTSLLAAEHAAVYAYGVLGARLDEQTRTVALAAFDAHRQQRSKLTVALRARQLPAAGPAASYDVAVTDRLAALRLAIRVETELGVRWRDLVAATDDVALRQLALAGLIETALRGTRWRRLAKVLPLTEAFPGQVSPR
jgi:hypothetical protein